jgi:hypothetical protein
MESMQAAHQYRICQDVGIEAMEFMQAAHQYRVCQDVGIEAMEFMQAAHQYCICQWSPDPRGVQKENAGYTPVIYISM